MSLNEIKNYNSSSDEEESNARDNDKKKKKEEIAPMDVSIDSASGFEQATVSPSEEFITVPYAPTTPEIVDVTPSGFEQVTTSPVVTDDEDQSTSSRLPRGTSIANTRAFVRNLAEADTFAGRFNNAYLEMRCGVSKDLLTYTACSKVAERKKLINQIIEAKAIREEDAVFAHLICSNTQTLVQLKRCFKEGIPFTTNKTNVTAIVRGSYVDDANTSIQLSNFIQSNSEGEKHMSGGTLTTNVRAVITRKKASEMTLEGQLKRIANAKYQVTFREKVAASTPKSEKKENQMFLTSHDGEQMKPVTIGSLEEE